ncbi:nucleotide exchange factor GrpE [Stygiobacter electus]|uniref:Protein GrpE n=1 Tax=Stygiobacter electus TaxID=3032292 RepID=A0AAE3P1P0_9BACT|nr:nucleotide exchange factor GrpE [Stygiobacter electus]MDF1611170.1 nucleotide exchange factor GrpE [Stygiobacter electus]
MEEIKDQNFQQENEELKEKEQEQEQEQEKEQEQEQKQEQNQERDLEENKLLKEKILELEKQNAELKDTLLRKVAEFENYKRRNENEQINLIKYAAEPFIKSILLVYDDFERSLKHIDDENNFEATKKGLQLVFDNFNKILESHGVKKIDAKGQPFDVHLHEALMQQPVDGVEPHTVLEVIEPGYMFKDKVIRHAKVIVSAEPASQDDNQQTNE